MYNNIGDKMKKKLISIGLIAVGIIMVVVSIAVLNNSDREHKAYHETTAIIVGHEDCELEDGIIGSRFVAQYAVEEATYQISGKECGRAAVEIDKKLKIKYNPDSPEDAVFVKSNKYYILTIVGSLFIIAGVILLIRNLLVKKV